MYPGPSDCHTERSNWEDCPLGGSVVWDRHSEMVKGEGTLSNQEIEPFQALSAGQMSLLAKLSSHMRISTQFMLKSEVESTF